jgi:transcription elongation factor GreA
MFNEMAQYFTKEGLRKLKDELKELKEVKIPENIKLIKYAASEGDLKENAGYHDARERKAWLLQRVEELENAINDAVILEKNESGAVQIGSMVSIEMAGDKESYEIVAPGSADILKNKMSYQSPLGSQLMGKKAGDAFNFEIRGKKMKVKVLGVT